MTIKPFVVSKQISKNYLKSICISISINLLNEHVPNSNKIYIFFIFTLAIKNNIHRCKDLNYIWRTSKFLLNFDLLINCLLDYRIPSIIFDDFQCILPIFMVCNSKNLTHTSLPNLSLYRILNTIDFNIITKPLISINNYNNFKKLSECMNI